MAIWKRAASDAARLAEADRARQQGELEVACRMYLRLAMSRQPNESTQAAKERLTELAAEAREKLKQIDETLAQEANQVSPGELLRQRAESTSPRVAQWQERVTAAFQQYDQVADAYHLVPAVANHLKTHVARQRRRPEYAIVLNEPEAKTLWEAAQQHEREDHLCCAYWVYRQAARLVPAPSARLAEQRFASLADDPQVVAAAEACRELQKCHGLYNRAERLVKLDPAKAKELFNQILAKAPDDSEVYRAAQNQVRELPQ